MTVKVLLIHELLSAYFPTDLFLLQGLQGERGLPGPEGKAVSIKKESSACCEMGAGGGERSACDIWMGWVRKKEEWKGSIEGVPDWQRCFQTGDH